MRTPAMPSSVMPNPAMPGLALRTPNCARIGIDRRPASRHPSPVPNSLSQSASAAGAQAPRGDTIIAIASARGGARRGVIRVSGPAAFAVVEAHLEAALPRERGVTNGRLSIGPGGLPAHILRMPGPRSFTREDVLELHLPGNGFLLDAVLAALQASGARLAEPGEFIRRAFANGALDLTRVEGVLALIQAQNEAEARAASALLFGGLEERMRAMRDRLEALRALCEASLDFDEAETGHVPSVELLELCDDLLVRVGEALTWEARREGTSQEPWVVLAGAPNAGKSTLFNALAETDAPALVAHQPGSTRDVLRAAWRLGHAALGEGLTVRLSDTAGFVPEDAEARLAEPDQKAQTQTRAHWRAADLLLWVVDATQPVWPDPSAGESFEGSRALLVWNQIDRPGAPSEPPAGERERFAAGWAAVSALRSEGLDDLAARVAQRFSQGAGDEAALAAPTPRSLGVRHRLALGETQARLVAAREGLRAEWPLDTVAEELRLATDALDQILGSTTPEDLLTRIFAQFCLGK